MKSTRIIVAAVLIVACGIALHAASAQLAGTKRIDLQRHDLSIPGREAIQVVVELAPGVLSPKHTHPGEEIIYVLEGSQPTRPISCILSELDHNARHHQRMESR